MTQIQSLVEAFDAFIVGCENDGIWDNITSSCVLMGWSNINGCLTPFKGVRPSGISFVSGDYNRELGLTSTGSPKFIDTNVNVSDVPLLDCHVSAYLSSGSVGVGSIPITNTGATVLAFSDPLAGRLRNTNFAVGSGSALAPSFAGFARSNNLLFSGQANNISSVLSGTAVNIAVNGNYGVFRQSTNFYAGTALFYSVGEYVDLSLLRTRVDTLISGIQNAIP